MLLVTSKNLLSFCMLISGWFVQAQPDPSATRVSQVEYIDKYKMVAVQDMLTTGVPASITLAQASLESDNGNSPLAINANNHFGIKCHDWTGNKYYHDDDAKQECFRKYGSAMESFNDHSYFLKNRQRYAFLFQIPRTDYKAWAYGLKKAGYATNPIYAEKLIDIIERNNLNELDRLDKVPKGESLAKADKITPSESQEQKKSIAVANKNIQFNNGIKYVAVQKGETYDDILKNYDMRMWQLRKYNDLSKSSLAMPGQKVYLQPKRRKCKEEFHVMQAGESMYMVSQRYGVKLKLLYKRNMLRPGEAVKPGQRISLKRKMKR